MAGREDVYPRKWLAEKMFAREGKKIEADRRDPVAGVVYSIGILGRGNT